VSDYPETENRAKAILGDNLFLEIIQQFPDSHSILYFLGKQPRKALPLPKLWDTNPVECAKEIKKIAVFLKAPVQKISKAPPPVPSIQATNPGIFRDKKSNNHKADAHQVKPEAENRPDPVESVEPGKQAESTPSENTSSQSPGSLPGSESPTKSDEMPWIKKATELGESLKRDYPELSQVDISKKVRAIMVERNITGRGGRVPHEDTIRKHALKGI
jgi:hypothetical protein